MEPTDSGGGEKALENGETAKADSRQESQQRQDSAKKKALRAATLQKLSISLVPVIQTLVREKWNCAVAEHGPPNNKGTGRIENASYSVQSLSGPISFSDTEEGEEGNSKE